MRVNSLKSAAEPEGWAAFEALGTALQSRLASSEKSERLKATHLLEAAFTGIVARLAPAVVLEIGAHGAEFSRDLKTKLPAARVVAFEANPQVFARYHDVCEEAGIEYLHLCVADAPGALRLRVPVSRRDGEPRLRAGSILPDLLKAGKSFDFVEHEVEATSVDAFLGEGAGTTPVALWIDVEGAVGAVLEGASKSLDACVAVYAEIGKREHWAGQLLDRQVVDLLALHGLVPQLRDSPRDAPLAQYNGLFVRRESLADSTVTELCAQCRRALTMN
jgi:FkbM family methyltransferase